MLEGPTHHISPCVTGVAVLEGPTQHISPCVTGVAVLEGPMYAVGGHDGWSYLNTVERWDPQARQWSFVAPMSSARSTVGVAVLANK